MNDSEFSFVIPVLDEQQGIASALRQLARLYPESERVVVDGGSTDDTVGQALPWCTSLLTCAAGRARQMNLGASVARGQNVFSPQA